MSSSGWSHRATVRVIGILVTYMMFVFTASAYVVIPGDVDNSGAVNAIDVQLVINRALGLDIGVLSADINYDLGVNATDVQLVINAALGLPISVPAVPTVTSFALDGDAAEAVSPDITLDNVCTGIPTQYMASESSVFAGAAWQTYATAPSFTLSAGNGVKTVYFKVKNTRGESGVSSDTINLNELVAGSEQTILLPGSVPLVMAWCPAGTFLMGRYSGEQDSLEVDEDPQHEVTLTQGFWTAKYELTKAQWEAVMGTTPWSGHTNVISDPDSPAVYVSWEDAQAFITALNLYTGLIFRLPTEAEWEYAARADTATRFYWGDDPSYSEIGNYAWYSVNCLLEQYAHVVGQKLPNAFGLYDMSGNVWEWVQDWYDAYPSGAAVDPTGPATGSFRVGRGGSWSFDAHIGRSARRGSSYPTNVYNFIGFRLVR